MANITFSVVTTVFNEEKSIESLLHSLLHQSVKPGEIIVVDAGSTDDTVNRIEMMASESPIPIRLLVHSGVNRSVGRNVGILAAKNTHIAVIDAGCEADENWLKELSLGFGGETQVVAGFYLPVIHKPIQRLFAAYVATLSRDLDVLTFLPSSRSLAFTKAAWEIAGKYPEHLDTCEDLVFAVALKQYGNMVVQREAIVYWFQVERFGQFFSQVSGYAQGDIEAGYMPHVFRIISVWIRYVFIIFLWPLIFAYILYPVVKHRREISSTRDIFVLPMIQFTADGAVLWGSLVGLARRLRFSRR